ncbi:MAG: hypothetical protein RR557_08230 [Bacilli bacterium]|jgi:hypothetical protein
MTQFQIEKAMLLIKEGFEVLEVIKSELDTIATVLNHGHQQDLLTAA